MFVGMDPTDYISIRFHFNGEFIKKGRSLHYVGGREEMSYVETEKLCMDELWRHLEVHYAFVEGQQMHWIFPGKEMAEGFMMLCEDNVRTMAMHITDCGVADIFVEDSVVGDKDASDWEVEEEYQKKDNSEGEESSEGSDYVPADSSTDDEETIAIKKDYKKFKEEKRRLAIECGDLDEVKEERRLAIEWGDPDEVKEEEEPDSSEDNDSYEEDSDGQVVRKESHYPRYKGQKVLLGMKFEGKKEFKDAIISYGLAERKEIKFIKDEGDRVRAKCTWETCPWVCLCKKTTRFASWQITAFRDEHCCPKRRDSSLVTSTRIANRFENLIKANPEWTAKQLKATVQEEMFANCHISKIKRAKKIVIERMLDAKRGEYS